MSFLFPLARFIITLVKDQIRLAREEIMGYAGGTTCCTAFIDDVIVFAIFLAVRSPHSNALPFSGVAQNRYLPIGYHVWLLYSEWDRNPPLPCEIKLCQPRCSKL